MTGSPGKWVSTTSGRHLRGRRKESTEPELLLRKALHAQGARFRVHRTLARGCTPDVVLSGRRIAVFVDGDYWHGCPEHGRKVPFSGPNAKLWTEKMRRNAERDERSTTLARDAGWTVVRLWECTIREDAVACARAALDGQSLPPVRRADSSA